MNEFFEKFLDQDYVHDFLSNVSDYTPLTDVIFNIIGHFNNRGKKLFKIIGKFLLHLFVLIFIFWKYKNNQGKIETDLNVYIISKIIMFAFDIYSIYKILTYNDDDICN